MYMLTCSSTADMPADYFKEREIPVVYFHYTIGGEEYPDDLGKSMPFKEFYKRISDGAMPTTSQVSVGQFIEFFEPFLREGKDIIHLSLSSGLSGSYNSAEIAKGELEDKYPNRKIYIVDSLGASSGYGLLLDMAADRRDSGFDIESLYNWLEESKLNINHWFFSTDLTHYKRGGRISATSATVGSILNICPLMNMDANGKLIPQKKVRGKKNVIKEIVKMMEDKAKDGYEYDGKCFISNSASEKDADKVAELIESKFPKLKGKVRINNIGTVIGSHTGPGTVALFFEGEKRQTE